MWATAGCSQLMQAVRNKSGNAGDTLIFGWRPNSEAGKIRVSFQRIKKQSE